MKRAYALRVVGRMRKGRPRVGVQWRMRARIEGSGE